MARNKDGTFVKGESANPGGRPRAPVRLRELYDKNEDDVRIYNRLWHWISSDDAKASVAAIKVLLERRYGGVATVDDNGEVVKDTTITVVVPRYDTEAMEPPAE